MTPAPPPARAHVAWIDAARTVACALVVLVHVNIYYRAGCATWWPFGFAGVPLYGLAVPAFMLMAGWVTPEPPTAPQLRRRLARLLPPFFLWNAILILTGSAGRDLSTGEIVFFLLTGANQLYFVFALVQLVCLHHLLGRWSEARRDRWLLLGGALASVAYDAAADVAVWTLGPRSDVFTLILNRAFAPWAIFYAAGVMLGRRRGLMDRLGRGAPLAATIAIAALSYALHVGELRLEERVVGFTPVMQFLLAGLPVQLAGSVLLLVGLRRLEASRGAAVVRALASAAPDTFGIYLSHVTVQAALFALWVRAGHEGAPASEVPILAAASWIVCQLGTRALHAVRRLAVRRRAATTAPPAT